MPDVSLDQTPIPSGQLSRPPRRKTKKHVTAAAHSSATLNNTGGDINASFILLKLSVVAVPDVVHIPLSPFTDRSESYVVSVSRTPPLGQGFLGHGELCRYVFIVDGTRPSFVNDTTK